MNAIACMSNRGSLRPPAQFLVIVAVLVSSCYCLIRASPSALPLPARRSTLPSAPSASLVDSNVSSPEVVYTFPLKVSKNGRYFEDRRGRPFRIQGDSAQSLIANLTYADADAYLADRCSKGFNTVNINLLERKFAINAPKNRRGDDPFTDGDNFATPYEAYFDFADS